MFPCYCLHFITEQIPCAEMILNKRQRELLLEFKKFYKISWCSTQKWEMTLNGVCNKQEWEIASFDDDVIFYLPASLYSTQKFQLHIFELQISTKKMWVASFSIFSFKSFCFCWLNDHLRTFLNMFLETIHNGFNTC